MKGQFATAWVYDENQILAYVLSDEEGWFVQIIAYDGHCWLRFAMSFDEAEKAWTYFEMVRKNEDNQRRIIENTVDELFEQAGKEYEDGEEVP